MKQLSSAVSSVFSFYRDGFRGMSWWGRRVWVIILIKLFVIFLILKIFFFQDFLSKRFSSDEKKSEYVLDQLINSK